MNPPIIPRDAHTELQLGVLLLTTLKEQNAKSDETTIKQRQHEMELNPRILAEEQDENPLSYYWFASSGGIQDRILSGVGFTIYQKPIPMPRPAATLTRNGIRVYSPKKTQGGAFHIELKRLLLVSMWREFPLFKDGDSEVDLHLSITYRIRRPNDHYKSSKRSDGVVKDAKLLARVTGGDIDNLIKYTLDSMNTVVYGDDKMITGICAKKLWCEDPESAGSTTVEVRKI
jgi:Holliday junction resolvase RusA-like endonuclease